MVVLGLQNRNGHVADVPSSAVCRRSGQDRALLEEGHHSTSTILNIGVEGHSGETDVKERAHISMV